MYIKYIVIMIKTKNIIIILTLMLYIKNLKNKCMFITMFICDASLGMVTPPLIGILASSARTSRGRKFPKGKELYSTERICL